MKSLLIQTLLIGSLVFNCNSDKKDDTSSLALFALLQSSSSTSYSSTCTTTFGTSVPDWIKNSFTCVTVSVSGSNYVFTTTSVPTYKSVYWGSTSSGYESVQYVNSGKSNYTNPNLIKSQNVVMTVPVNNTSTSAPSSNYGAIGIATNGIVIYNDQAAPGDSLTTEYYTFDSKQGHPTSTGAYHYHVEPPAISVSDSKLVGIALDGYLIFGKLHDTTSSGVTTGFTLGGSTSSTKCTATPTAVPTTWTYASNYKSSTGKTDSDSYHYHVNNGTEVNGIILSGKHIGAVGTVL